jgi:hypothetical protein
MREDDGKDEESENDEDEEEGSGEDTTPKQTQVNVLLGNSLESSSSQPLSATPVVQARLHTSVEDDSVTGISDS